MLCNRCKNPIADNATICEWCGMIVVIPEKEKPTPQQVVQQKTNALEAGIIDLLKQGQKSQALALCKQSTGLNKADSHYYVARLNFFLRHEHATEIIWQTYVRKAQKGRIWSKLVAWIFLPFNFLAIIGICMNFSEPEYKFDNTDVTGFIITILFTLLIIFWVYKSKKKLL